MERGPYGTGCWRETDALGSCASFYALGDATTLAVGSPTGGAAVVLRSRYSSAHSWYIRYAIVDILVLQEWLLVLQ